MLVKLYNENPNPAILKQVVDCLNKGGLVIYPTDTVYALGCDIHNKAAIDKVARIKGIKAEKADFSFVFYDLSHISEYTQQFDSSIFKLLKRNLPGPFTFILPANKTIAKLFKNNKKTLGIRVPDNNICREIVKLLGSPIISTSIHDEDDVIEYTTDPELIHEKYENLVDIVIDGGFGNNEASTVVDLSEGYPEIIRQGIGELLD
ncbi:MAG: threonylcarbamoyl-AMP synthase [Bacteroidetes bacterium]|nr:MAG: threonylcarbamoyl-AMP synthase [Bacteroidota bacterium]MBL1144387.1 threonylcarbamoyl-AMP synthase [Bacteroidota bacterium]MCB0803309.1 threonylcarbamoyl-AMP synthase [Flavobacteriales bacterium]NOG57183.1 threonylcarbamoyl-AMP synthase [Bacteroidota bacterium]